MRFTLVFNKEPEGGYTVEVLELPGCVSYGETIEEAKKMIKDAIKGYIYSLKKHWELEEFFSENMEVDNKFISFLEIGIDETVQA